MIIGKEPVKWVEIYWIAYNCFKTVWFRCSAIVYNKQTERRRVNTRWLKRERGEIVWEKKHLMEWCLKPKLLLRSDCKKTSPNMQSRSQWFLNALSIKPWSFESTTLLRLWCMGINIEQWIFCGGPVTLSCYVPNRWSCRIIIGL